MSDLLSESCIAQVASGQADLALAAIRADTEELQAEWFNGRQRVGLTAGASAPEILVRQVIDRIKALGAVSVRKMQGIEETVKFPLPKGLRLDGPNATQPEHLR